MTELQKLLTFMYEEDMQKVLSMYNSLFGDACNEAILMDFLGSPTRQAVMLARAYNARERKLKINSSSREDNAQDGEIGAEFINAMNRLRQEAEKQGIVYAAEQFGFDTQEQEPQKREVRSVWEDKHTPSEPDTGNEAAVSEVKEEKPEPDGKAGSEPPRKEEESSEAESTEEKREEKTEETTEERKEETSAVKVDDEDIRFDFSEKKNDAPEEVKKVETVKKTSVPLAVIYSIFAIPITLVISVILLIPTFLALALAAVGIIVSFKLITSAFGGFAIFADIMVVLGAGLITAALGLLFLWMFVWFIGGAIAGVISGAIRLGEKLCTREVEVK